MRIQDLKQGRHPPLHCISVPRAGLAVFTGSSHELNTGFGITGIQLCYNHCHQIEICDHVQRACWTLCSRNVCNSLRCSWHLSCLASPGDEPLCEGARHLGLPGVRSLSHQPTPPPGRVRPRLTLHPVLRGNSRAHRHQ